MEGEDEGDLLDEVWKLTSKFYLDRSFGGNDWEKVGWVCTVWFGWWVCWRGGFVMCGKDAFMHAPCVGPPTHRPTPSTHTIHTPPHHTRTHQTHKHNTNKSRRGRTCGRA